MKNILIFSDIHINLSSLKECVLILEEIGMLANKYNVDTFINLGDTFNGIKPSSLEMDIFATFINRTGNKKHIILAANSHESESEQISILNHYGILSNNVQIVKEFKDGTHLYCGHYSLKESSSNYDAKLSKEDLKQYLYVFLGHIHSYQLIPKNIVHLGSCRYVNFDETKDKQKIIALITDYNQESEKVHFLKLKSPIPMVQLELHQKDSKETISDTIVSKNRDTSIDAHKLQSSILQAQTTSNSNSFDSIEQIVTFLNALNANTKVKIVIKDFENYRNFLSKIGLYQSKFIIFKIETDFEVIAVNNQKCKDIETISFREVFKSWIEKQSIDNSIKKILLKEIE